MSYDDETPDDEVIYDEDYDDDLPGSIYDTALDAYGDS